MHELSSFLNLPLRATDGQVGTVDDVYFDDQTWDVCYLLVGVNGWADRHQVLVPRSALETLQHRAAVQNNIPLSWSKANVEAAPPIGQHLPVSRQHELRQGKFFGWPGNWPQGAEETRAILTLHAQQPHDEHLRSFTALLGYTIRGTDGDAGRLENLVIDDDWQIRYLVVDLGHWLTGRKALLEPRLVDHIEWTDSLLLVSIPRAEVERAPEFISAGMIDGS